MDTPIRLLLVDGHPKVRVALAERLRQTAGVAAVAACCTLDEARQRLQEQTPNVVLYDPRTVGAAAVEAIGLLRQTGCPVVVLTATVLPEEKMAWTRAGAAAILLKGQPVSELLARMAQVVRGH